MAPEHKAWALIGSTPFSPQLCALCGKDRLSFAAWDRRGPDAGERTKRPEVPTPLPILDSLKPYLRLPELPEPAPDEIRAHIAIEQGHDEIHHVVSVRPHVDHAAHGRRTSRELPAREHEFDIAKVQSPIGQSKDGIGRSLIAHDPEVTTSKDNSEFAGEVHDGRHGFVADAKSDRLHACKRIGRRPSEEHGHRNHDCTCTHKNPRPPCHRFPLLLRHDPRQVLPTSRRTRSCGSSRSVPWSLS
jgi:hypothetical protein